MAQKLRIEQMFPASAVIFVGLLSGRERVMQECASQALLAMLIAAFAVWPVSVGHAACPERPPCHGCGCKGGPGYRGPDDQCVGFRELDKVCGNPPTTRCKFENAPGTGENRECALAPRRDRLPKAVIGNP